MADIRKTSLPEYYRQLPDDPHERYLHDVFSLLEEHTGLYDFQLTKIFKDDITKRIPEEWVSPLSDATFDALNEIPYGHVEEFWPNSLKSFIESCLRLSLDRGRHDVIPPILLTKAERRGMNPKKAHEISCLAASIDEICRKNKCRNIIDVGSGLGYLSLLLCKKFDYHVIGLENKESRSHGAEQRANKCDVSPENFKAVTFDLQDSTESFTCFGDLINNMFHGAKDEVPPSCASDHPDTTNTASRKAKVVCEERANVVHDAQCSVVKELSEEVVKDGVCMLGLHCCGDLTPTMLRLFRSVPEIRCFVCISCCYHRMQPEPSGGGYKNFPLSSIVKKHIETHYVEWQMSQFALRLAAQETRTRWRNQSVPDHVTHINNVGYRGVLEVVLGGVPERGRRRLVHRGDTTDLGSYIRATSKTLQLQDDEFSEFENKMHKVYDEHKHLFSLVEPLTCLQVLLQPVLETLITLDRVWYLTEQEDAEVIGPRSRTTWVTASRSYHHQHPGRICTDDTDTTYRQTTDTISVLTKPSSNNQCPARTDDGHTTESSTNHGTTIQARIVPVFEEDISPRNLAIMAEKSTP